MRVLVVATQIRLPDAHGGSTHVGELVDHLRERGPVRVLARYGSRAPDVVGLSFKLGYPPGIKHVVPLAYFPPALWAARRFRPDVIYERGSSYGLGAMLSVALGVPLLCMVLDEHRSWLSLHRASRVIATDPGLVPRAVRHKTVKVSWGANAERFHPRVSGDETRRRYGLSGPTVCYVGSFRRWHGLEDLVAAVDLLSRRLDVEMLHFLMVGDGPLRSDVEARVRAAGLTSHFTFTGAVPYERVPALVAAADICVAPFRPERHPCSADGFVLDPLKVFEYLAMGKPAITVHTDNIAAMFTDGEDLRLVPSGDVAALAEAIAQCARSPDAAREMGQRGRCKVLARHTWQAHVTQLYSLFEEMVAESASSR